MYIVFLYVNNLRWHFGVNFSAYKIWLFQTRNSTFVMRRGYRELDSKSIYREVQQIVAVYYFTNFQALDYSKV